MFQEGWGVCVISALGQQFIHPSIGDASNAIWDTPGRQVACVLNAWVNDERA